MGVDCRIMLPPDVRLHDVADIIGLLAGCEKETITTKNGTYTRVKCVSIRTAGTPTLASIDIAKPITLKGGDTAHVYYHFETDGNYRLMSPRSTGWWIAVGKRLVDFFGGEVDYSDCDEKEVDYKKPKPRKSNNPQDGAPWHKFQREKWATVPLTEAEVNECWTLAAYDKTD
jgi:hypothetical protein